jgi:Fe-S-cluster-containing dehydrogenase component
MIKCDLCISRLEHAMKPACVSACRTGALTFEFDDKKTAKDAIIVFKKAG